MTFCTGHGEAKIVELTRDKINKYHIRTHRQAIFSFIILFFVTIPVCARVLNAQSKVTKLSLCRFVWFEYRQLALSCDGNFILFSL